MTESPNVQDVLLGRRLRTRRRLLGLPQQALADALGVTYQQVQKYERGANRISAERLFLLAKVLRVELGYFFVRPTSQNQALGVPDLVLELRDPEFRALNEAFVRISDPEIRARIISLIERIGEVAVIGTLDGSGGPLDDDII